MRGFVSLLLERFGRGRTVGLRDEVYLGFVVTDDVGHSGDVTVKIQPT